MPAPRSLCQPPRSSTRCASSRLQSYRLAAPPAAAWKAAGVAAVPAALSSGWLPAPASRRSPEPAWRPATRTRSSAPLRAHWRLGQGGSHQLRAGASGWETLGSAGSFVCSAARVAGMRHLPVERNQQYWSLADCGSRRLVITKKCNAPRAHFSPQPRPASTRRGQYRKQHDIDERLVGILSPVGARAGIQPCNTCTVLELQGRSWRAGMPPHRRARHICRAGGRQARGRVASWPLCRRHAASSVVDAGGEHTWLLRDIGGAPCPLVPTPASQASPPAAWQSVLWSFHGTESLTTRRSPS